LENYSPKVIVYGNSHPLFFHGLIRLLESFNFNICLGDTSEDSVWYSPKADLLVRCALSTHAPLESTRCQPPYNDVPTLLVSEGWNETEAAVTQAGFKGYLGRGCLPEHLFNALNVLLQGGTYYHPGHYKTPSIGLITHRQLQVLKLIGQGLTDGEISHQLGVSNATVRHHLESLYQRLQIERRGELIALAERGGLNP
jgi:DNA-binding NarL/FixJ family response regulator